MHSKIIFRKGIKEGVTETFTQGLDIISEGMRKAAENGLQQSCINCLHFDEATELCGKFKQRPPARVIALSCDTGYEDNESIPF